MKQSYIEYIDLNILFHYSLFHIQKQDIQQHYTNDYLLQVLQLNSLLYDITADVLLPRLTRLFE